MRKSGSPIRGTLILGIAGLLGQTLGFVQLLIFLAFYGSNSITDAYVIAMTLPWFISTLFNQPFSNIFVPVFTTLSEQKSEQEAWRFTCALFITTFLMLLALSLLVYVFAGSIVQTLAPQMNGESLTLSESLLHLLSIYVLLSSMCGLPRSVFISYQSFVIPAVLWLVPSLSIISAIFFLHDGYGIYAPAIGIIIGAFLRLAVLLSCLNLGQRRIRFRFQLWHEGITEFYSLLVQRFIILATTSINVMVDRGFASGLGASYISALYYGDMIHSAPVGLLRSSFGSALLPILSRSSAKGDMQAVAQQLQRSVGLGVFAIAPISVCLIVLAEPLVLTVFRQGVMDSASAKLIAIALACYSVGMIPQAVNSIFGAGFLALKDVRIPLIVSIIIVFVNIVLDLVLIQYFGIAGLAIASSIVICIRMALLGWALRARISHIELKPIYFSVSRICLAAISMGCVMAGIAISMNLFQTSEHRSLQSIQSLVIVGLSGGIAYFFSCWLLRCEELFLIFARLKMILRSRGLL